MKFLRWITSTLLYFALAFFLTATTISFIFTLNNANNLVKILPLIIDCIGLFLFVWYFLLLVFFTLNKNYQFNDNFNPSLKLIAIFICGVSSGSVYFIFNNLYTNNNSLYPDLYYFLGLFVLQICFNFVIIFLDVSLFIQSMKQFYLRKKLTISSKDKKLTSENIDIYAKKLVDKMEKQVESNYNDNNLKNNKVNKKDESYWKTKKK